MRYISERNHKLHIIRDWLLAAAIILLCVCWWWITWLDAEVDRETELTNHALIMWTEKIAEVEEYRREGFIVLHSPVLIKHAPSKRKK